jgi:glycosyltransferase involved in cell wall biosynthesis
MHVVTIVSRNYLGRATVLARTHRQHNPLDPLSVLVVDAEPGELPDHEDFTVITPADLSLAAAEFERMALIYGVTELCTALKPWALELLLDRGADVATYLDPDIAVYAPLEQIEKLSLEHGIVLTPHTTVPMARDGLDPTEAHIMAAGTFNLGFLAVDQGSRSMLTWWQERLRRDCISAPHEMLFVDQRWVDLVPGYFRHVVLTDPTYNVAYWNLDSRPLVRVDGEVHVQAHGPLHFFHFSGYQPERPWVLTQYHVEQPRVVLSEHPVVAELCQEYGAWITDPALGSGAAWSSADAPYRFDRLPDGTRITAPMRAALRRALVGADRTGAGHPPGWRDHVAVRQWFLDPVRVGCPTNRYLHAVWESRPDLQHRFPAPLGGDAAALVEWGQTWAMVDPDLVAGLLPDPAAVAVTTTERARGVNLAGYFTAEMGVGEMGRMLVDGVRAAGLPCSTVLNTSTLSRQQHRFGGSADRTRYLVTVVAVNADQLPGWARESDPALRLGYTIGMWAWEIEEFTGYDEALALVDEVWTLSAFSRDAIARATTKPVHVIPLPIREPVRGPELDRAPLGIPERPYVLFAFDYLSVFERKNPLGVVEAFRRAFPDGDGPTLVIKSVNGELRRVDRERLRRAAGGSPDVVLLEDYLDSGQLGALMDGCTAYISLHRAEGYGLTMAEAMARRRPVVATAYSGNLDFMDESNALLVPYRLVPVVTGSGPYPTTSVWAEPDLDAAAAHLRWVVEHPDAAEALGARAAAHVLESRGGGRPPPPPRGRGGRPPRRRPRARLLPGRRTGHQHCGRASDQAGPPRGQAVGRAAPDRLAGRLRPASAEPLPPGAGGAGVGAPAGRPRAARGAAQPPAARCRGGAQRPAPRRHRAARRRAGAATPADRRRPRGRRRRGQASSLGRRAPAGDGPRPGPARRLRPPVLRRRRVVGGRAELEARRDGAPGAGRRRTLGPRAARRGGREPAAPRAGRRRRGGPPTGRGDPPRGRCPRGGPPSGPAPAGPPRRGPPRSRPARAPAPPPPPGSRPPAGRAARRWTGRTRGCGAPPPGARGARGPACGGAAPRRRR